MYIRSVKKSIFTGMSTHKRYNLEEDVESIRFAGYLLMLQRQGKLEVYSHIPHETYTTSWNQKKNNKLKGVRAGVPDYIIVIKGFVVFLEMKRKKGGVVSPEQKQWLEAVNNKITVSTVAKGYEEAKHFIDILLTRATA